MSKEIIEDAVYEEVNGQTEKVNYEVAVEFTENFLEKNPTIKDVYAKGKMNIGLLPNVDKEFVEHIVGLIPELNSNEIVLFNPLIDAINTLASQDFIVEADVPKRLEGEEDKEFSKRKKTYLDEQYRKLTDITKSVGSFNTALKTSKKVMKDPLLERGRKIDSLYNALSSFSEKRKEIAKGNFKKYIAIQEKIKEQAEAKKNAAALAEKQALEEKNAEQAGKIEALSQKSSYADLMTEVSDYFTEKEKDISKLNLQGLEDLLIEVESKNFDVSSQGDLEQIKLEGIATNLKSFLVIQVNKAKRLFTEESQKTEDSVKKESFNTEVKNDVENFADIIRRLNSIKGELDGMTKFADPRLEKINEKLFEQIEIIKKTNGACIKYVGGVQEKYNAKK